MPRLVLTPLGSVCANADGVPHPLLPATNDIELQAVLGELTTVGDLAPRFTSAITVSIDYVLDGRRTGRFDLLGPDVHPGERASVGAKLEYELIYEFDWTKTKPLDVVFGSIPVDLKATVGDNWSIPDEAHCQLCICTKIELKRRRHRSWLVRAHRSWLYRGKGNKDGKRGLAVEARDNWAHPLYEWAPLPLNPLSTLEEQVRAMVFDRSLGQRLRLEALFRALPNTVISRSVIETVCSGWDDPIRRVREAKKSLELEGIQVLAGAWVAHVKAATDAGFDLGKKEWLAIKSDVPTPGQIL